MNECKTKRKANKTNKESKRKSMKVYSNPFL